MIGVGVMAPEHKFHHSHANEPHFRPIQTDLVSLGELCDSVVNHNYTEWSPVADTSNHLFFVPPPKHITISPEISLKIEEIKKLLANINEKLLTVSEEQLAMIDTIVLVAGSVLKAPAIYELLSRLNIRYLCIDEKAAQTLLRM